MPTFHLDWFSFLISFAIGMAFVYFTIPHPKLVFKYPTPENAGKIIYQDSQNRCYTYSIDKVSCPIKSDTK